LYNNKQPTTMKKIATLGNGKTLKVRTRKETREMNDAYLDFISKFEEEMGVSSYEQGFTTIEHEELLKNKFVDVSVFSHYTMFLTDEWSLTINPYNNKGIEIFKIEAKKSKSGVGSNLMNNILDIADELNLEVNLVPVPFQNRFGVIPAKENILRDWYKSFGFVTKPFTTYFTYKPNN